MADLTPLPLSVREVSIRHDERTGNTPDDVSFDIAAGEVVLLLSSSGSGRSTLALALNGLVPHAVSARLSGSVHARGVHTVDASGAQVSERVAMVFQDPDAQIATETVTSRIGTSQSAPLSRHRSGHGSPGGRSDEPTKTPAEPRVRPRGAFLPHFTTAFEDMF
jgi:ABC-type glutathione transport system ATPase component